MGGILPTLAEVQGMPLIVLDDELCCSPGGVMHVLHKGNATFLQRGCCGRDIVGFKIEMEVFALIAKLDRGIFLVYEF
jgi:hypothetical protein